MHCLGVYLTCKRKACISAISYRREEYYCPDGATASRWSPLLDQDWLDRNGPTNAVSHTEDKAKYFITVTFVRHLYFCNLQPFLYRNRIWEILDLAGSEWFQWQVFMNMIINIVSYKCDKSRGIGYVNTGSLYAPRYLCCSDSLLQLVSHRPFCQSCYHTIAKFLILKEVSFRITYFSIHY